MKKYLVLAIICSVFVMPLMIGCTTTGPNPVTNFFCHPTDSQKMAAKVGLAIVQSAISVGAAYLGVQELAALVDAQSLYQSVVDGVCATQTQWDEATQAVEAAQTTKGVKVAADNLAILHQTKW